MPGFICYHLSRIIRWLHANRWAHKRAGKFTHAKNLVLLRVAFLPHSSPPHTALKRGQVHDERESKAILTKLQEEITKLRSQNLRLESELTDVQEQLRRSRYLSKALTNTSSTTSSGLGDHHTSSVAGNGTSSPHPSIPPISFSSALTRSNDSLEAPTTGEQGADGTSANAPDTPSSTSGFYSARRVERYSLVLSAIARDRGDRLDSASQESLDSPSGASRNSPSVTYRVEHLKIELDSAQREIAKLQDTNGSLTKKLREAESQLSRAKATQRTLESQEEDSALELKRSEKRAEEAEAKRRELLAERDDLLHQETKYKAAIVSMHKDLAKAKEEATTLRSALEKQEALVKRETESRRKLAEELERTQNEVQGKELERTQLTRSASRAVDDLQGSRSEISNLEQKAAKLERESNSLQTTINSLETQLKEKQVKIDTAQADARKSVEKMKELGAQLSASEESVKKSLAAKKKAEDTASELESKALEREQALAQMSSELDHRKQDVELLESNLKHIKTTVEVLEKSIEGAKKAEADAQAEVAQAKHEKDRIASQLAATEISVEQLQRELAKAQTQSVTDAVNGAQTAVSADSSSPESIAKSAELELKLRELNDKLTSSQKDKLDAEKKYSTAEKERSRQQDELKRVSTDLARAQADLMMGGRIVTELQAKIKESEQRYTDSERLTTKQEKVAGELRTDLGNAKREIKIKDGLLKTHQETITDLNAKLKVANDETVTAKSDASSARAELHSAQESLKQNASPSIAAATTSAAPAVAGGSAVSDQKGSEANGSSQPPHPTPDANAPSQSSTASSNGTSVELSAELSKTKAELEELTTSLDTALSELKSTKHQKATMAMQIHNLQSKVDSSTAELALAQKKLKDLESGPSNLEATASVSAASAVAAAEMQLIRERLTTAEQELKSKTADLDKFKSEQDKPKQAEVKESEELSKTRLEVERLSTDLVKAKADLAKAKSDARQTKTDTQLIKSLTQQCEHWQHKASDLQKTVDTIKREMGKNPPLRAALEAIVRDSPALQASIVTSPTKEAKSHGKNSGGSSNSSGSSSGNNGSSLGSGSATSAKDEAKVILLQSHIRGALSRLKHKHWRYRYLKVKEMVDTEESYLKILDLGHAYYFAPLQGLNKLGESILTNEEIESVFGVFNDIRKNNREVVAMLRARFDTWNAFTREIGDVFLEVLRRKLLEPHIVFASYYSKSTENRVRLTKENATFSQLQTVVRMLPPMEGRSLEDILISPIQRIPRYILLLQDMVKHTLPSHIDYSNLQTALTSFQQYATFINENNRRTETMADISTRLMGYESLPENPNRKLLLEGRLNHFVKTEKTNRYAFLFNDYIVFGKENKNKRKSGPTTASKSTSSGSLGSNSSSGSSEKISAKVVAMIKISANLTIMEIGMQYIGAGVQPCLFSLNVGESTNLLQSLSDTEMKLWVSKLRETIEQHAANGNAKTAHQAPLAPPAPSKSDPSITRSVSPGSASDPSGAPSSAPKDRSKKLAVGASTNSGGSTSPNSNRALSPNRAASLHNVYATTPSIHEEEEDGTGFVSSSSGGDLSVTVGGGIASSGSKTPPLLQSSSSSGSLELGSSRKARTLAKRHKDKPKNEQN